VEQAPTLKDINVPTAEDVLGEQSTQCGFCARPIDIRQDRRRCASCRKNYCVTCPECGMHQTFLIKGFPELSEDLHALQKRADAIFAEISFHVDYDIYFGGIQQILPLLRSKAQGQPVDLPVAEGRWLEEHGEPFIRRFLSLKAMGRFVDYFERRAFPGRCANAMTFQASQGTTSPIRWRGLPMMRTIWDFALAPLMVQEIRPRTIIEIGTASGGAAAYYADVQQLHGIQPNVITMDIAPPAIQLSGVTIIRGDSKMLAVSLPVEFLDPQPHPWIVIEDAHQAIGEFLEHMHLFVCKGDYLVIEDLDAEGDLFGFLSEHPAEYKVDTLFTDFFGHNNTCAPDQILCKITE
jgi:cephalosporin hydroxylase